jgi:hypothetical protein
VRTDRKEESALLEQLLVLLAIITVEMSWMFIPLPFAFVVDLTLNTLKFYIPTWNCFYITQTILHFDLLSILVAVFQIKLAITMFMACTYSNRCAKLSMIACLFCSMRSYLHRGQRCR